MDESIARRIVAPNRDGAVEARRRAQASAANLPIAARQGAARTGFREPRKLVVASQAQELISARTAAQEAVLRQEQARNFSAIVQDRCHRHLTLVSRLFIITGHDCAQQRRTTRDRASAN